MTSNLEPGYRMFTGEQLNTNINAATTGATGPTGPTGPTGITGAGSPVSAPGTASSTGVAGTWAYDATHIYVCIATNTWCRATIATF